MYRSVSRKKIGELKTHPESARNCIFKINKLNALKKGLQRTEQNYSRTIRFLPIETIFSLTGLALAGYLFGPYFPSHLKRRRMSIVQLRVAH
jgi:hypothetical protein